MSVPAFLTSLVAAKCNLVSSGEARSRDVWFVRPAGRGEEGGILG